jgi:broad specificity phosphatase PhoE
VNTQTLSEIHARFSGGDSVDLIFIRHGYGEHLIDYPNQLDTLHPGLTEYGVYQINQLREHISIFSDDVVIVSPTKRTIQTAQLLTQTNEFIVSPYVGNYKEVTILDFGLNDWGEGINRIDQELFEGYGKQLLEWCLSIGNRIIIISHDGTITNYRLLLGEKGLTRKDFLGEAGVLKTIYESKSKMA